MAASTATSLETVFQQIEKNYIPIAQKYYPVIAPFFDRSKVITQTKFEWPELTLYAPTDNLFEPITSNSQTVIKVRSSVANGLRHYVTTATANTPLTLKNDAGVPEMMKVTAVTVNADHSELTVVRGQYGTTALASFAKGTTVTVGGAISVDGAAMYTNSSQFSHEEFNYIQTFEDAIAHDMILQKVETAANEGEMNVQMARVTKNMMGEIQNAFFKGRRFQDPGKTFRMSGGLTYFAELNGNSKHQGNKKLGQNVLLPIIEKIIDNGVEKDGLVCYLPFAQQSAINELKESLVVGNMSMGERKIDYGVETYNFGSLAQIQFVHVNSLDPDEVVIACKKHMKIRPLNNQYMQRKVLAATGKTDSEAIYSTLGFEIKNAKQSVYHLTGLSTGGAK